MAGIITAMEVVFASDAGREFPVNLVDKSLRVQERGAFRSTEHGCGSIQFYEHLESVLNTEASGATEYNPAQDYNTGDIVWQNGQYFKSTANANGNEPVSLESWTLVNKFTNAVLEDLWIDHIRPWLANYILSRSLVMATFGIGQQGVTEWFDDRTGQKAASRGTIAAVQDELKARVADLSREMVERIWETHRAGDYDFSGLGLPDETDILQDRARRSRIGFRY